MKKLSVVEMLLLLLIVFMVLAITIILVNPTKQSAEYRDAQRLADMQIIINAVTQYKWDNEKIPDTITENDTEICKTGMPSCTGMVDLSVLTDNEQYLRVLPSDPLAKSVNGTGYLIRVEEKGRIRVSAPLAENNNALSVVR